MALLMGVALAGGAGSLLRYLLSQSLSRILGGSLWGTLAVNTQGCLAAGLVAGLLLRHLPVGERLQTAVLAGFFGGFTTFSSLMLEVFHQCRALSWGTALGSLVLQNLTGLVSVLCGWKLSSLALLLR